MTSILDQTRVLRFKESYGSVIKPWDGTSQTDYLFALAPSDQGIIRNGGRLGSRWAPRAVLAQLQKLALSENASPIHWFDSTTQVVEQENFVEAQKVEESHLVKAHLATKNLIHLGGGHDHVLPLLRALGKDHPLVVINIDAHCDTRIGDEPHSGNPFRVYAQEAKHDFKLFQIGIHPFANSQTTLSPLPKGEMAILYRDQCEDEAVVRAFLSRILGSIAPNARLIFSLDCDALKASDVGAVSAPNHHGLSLAFVLSLIKWYNHWCGDQSQRGLFGIYEFNPLYDTVSGSSARVMAGLLYEIIGPTRP